MSLINDVLRNLEANRPDDLAGHQLQREIRSLPPAKSPRLGRRVALLGLLPLALGAAAWHWHDRLGALLVADAPRPPAAHLPAVVAAPAAPDALPLENLILAQELLSRPLPPPESALAAAPAAVPVAAPDPLEPALPVHAPVLAAPPAVEKAVPPPLPVADAAPAVTPAKVETSIATPVLAKIEKNPLPVTPRDRAEVDVRRAEAAFAGGRGEEGREALRAALRQDPAYLQVRQLLLRHLLAERRIDEAIVVLQEGLELQPAQTGWALSLARLQLEQGDAAAADRTLARSQGFAENSADYAGFQGLLKSRLGAPRQAAAHYQRATRLAPDDGRWWLGLGLALEGDNRLPESREALRRALSLPNLPSELAAVAEQHLR